MGREFRLALTKEGMHALGEREAKARPMPILESNHKRENHGMSSLDISQAMST